VLIPPAKVMAGGGGNGEAAGGFIEIVDLI
jgi:hypothetical protein